MIIISTKIRPAFSAMDVCSAIYVIPIIGARPNLTKVLNISCFLITSATEGEYL
jgi:hypothetical protein